MLQKELIRAIPPIFCTFQFPVWLEIQLLYLEVITGQAFTIIYAQIDEKGQLPCLKEKQGNWYIYLHNKMFLKLIYNFYLVLSKRLRKTSIMGTHIFWKIKTKWLASCYSKSALTYSRSCAVRHSISCFFMNCRNCICCVLILNNVFLYKLFFT